MEQQNKPQFNQNEGQLLNNNQVSSKSRAKIYITIIALAILLSLVTLLYLKGNVLKQNNGRSGKEQLSKADQEKINGIYNDLINNTEGLTASQIETMNLIAKDRSIESIDTTSLEYTEVSGYSTDKSILKFKTAWGVGKVSERTKSSAGFKQLEFKNGNKLVIDCFNSTPREEFLIKNPSAGPVLPKEDTDQILNLLGTKADSGFEYLNFLYSINSGSIKNSRDVDSAEALSKLLFIKSVSTFSSKQPYRISIGDTKGFQFGDYSKPQSTTVLLFPDTKSMCRIMAAETNKITQKDIDIIVSTFGMTN